jgi:hypothetical protein
MAMQPMRRLLCAPAARDALALRDDFSSIKV